MSQQEKKGIVTVMVAMYNHEATVVPALESLLQSDVSKVELIVCDDKSKDNSIQVCRTWLEQHGHHFESWQLIENEVNLGINGNLNKLVALANGEYLTHFASDDLLAPQAIDLQRNYMLRNSDKDFVWGNCAIIDLQGSTIKARVINGFQNILFKIQFFLMLDLIYVWGLPWCRLFGKTKVFRSFGPYPSEYSLEDRWSALKITETKRFGYMHNVVHLYRFRGRGENQYTPGVDQMLIRSDCARTESDIYTSTSIAWLRGYLWFRTLPYRLQQKNSPQLSWFFAKLNRLFHLGLRVLQFRG